MAEWKPFDLKWGRNIWYCSACEESTEVPTYLGTPMYNFCPMCGADMNMKSENKTADTPQTDCETCRHYKLACELFSEVCKYEPTTQNSNLTFETDTPQTETPTNSEKFQSGVELKQTDCGWGEPNED